jgi:uncharacterized cupredoxin-like copper-binding protein
MRRLLVLALPLLLVGIAGCGDDGDGGGGDDDSAGTTVDATLQDFSIDLSADSASAGQVTFAITNNGPSTHEFVVLATDLAPGDLPTDDAGDVAEDEVTPVDEAEDIADGDHPELTVDLEPGHYVVICNVPGHYRQGMAAELTVT